MKLIEVYQGITDVHKYASLIFDLTNQFNSEEEFEKALSRELTKDELRTIRSIAQEGYPLSLDGMQK